ncbi:MAG: UvrD-helicase domain-containing protein, partial [Verrucomicrobiota bacterium]
RRHFQAAAAPLLLAARQADLGPDRMARLLSVVARDPGVRRLTRTTLDRAEAEARWRAAWSAAAGWWRSDGATLRAFFGSATRWGNSPYNRDDAMAEWFAKLEALLGVDGPNAHDLSALANFTPEALANGRRKRGQEPPPAHPFFTACGEVMERAEDLGQAHWAAFLEGAAAAVRARLEQDNTVGFDDLLTRVRDALRGPGGGALRAVLRRRYGAALIDEFQDTDPVQFEIFERAFTPAGDFQLYLVGDPKQAIYSFRGADIFAYLGARRLVDREYTLGDNFRSAGGLVRAVNALFDHPRPFGLAQVGFHPVTARGRADAAPLTEDGERRAPLQVWFCDPGEEISRKPDQEERLAEAVAAEVVRLLAGGTRLGDRPLAPAGLAVLVDRHEQAERVRRARARRGVPAVQQTQGSLWETDEAADLDRVLRAMDQPSREDLVRGALAT